MDILEYEARVPEPQEGRPVRMSTHGRCELRGMIELASRSSRALLQVEATARGQGVSEKQPDVLVTGLEPTDLVRALRGTSSGHVLTRDPSTIMALDVMSVLEGETAPADGVVDVPARHHWSRRAVRDVGVRGGLGHRRRLRGHHVVRSCAKRAGQGKEGKVVAHVIWERCHG